jgi:hypothetical protein
MLLKKRPDGDLESQYQHEPPSAIQANRLLPVET